VNVEAISKDRRRCGVTPSPRIHRAGPRITSERARRSLTDALKRAERAGDRPLIDRIHRLMGGVR
jgi:hypothetical protein